MGEGHSKEKRKEQAATVKAASASSSTSPQPKARLPRRVSFWRRTGRISNSQSASESSYVPPKKKLSIFGTNPFSSRPEANGPVDGDSDRRGRVGAASEADSRRRSMDIIRDIIPDPEMGQLLGDVPIFAHLSRSERNKLGGALVERVCAVGDVVFKEGDPGLAFFVIKSGKCAVTQAQGQGQAVLLTTLSDGDHFGEQALLSDCARTATVAATTRLVLLQLSKVHFNALFKKHRLAVTFAQRRRVAVSAEGGNEQQYSHLRSSQRPPGERPVCAPVQPAPMSAEVRQLVLNAVHKSLLFQTLEDEHKEALASVMHALEVPSGHVLVRQGEEGDRFYIVEEGAFDVYQRDENGSEQKVEQHAPGGSFGESALMYDTKHSASVVAVARSRVRVLERHVLNAILEEVSQAQLERYSRWLARVGLLAPLTNQERLVISEALEVVDCDVGASIFEQGAPGDALYIIVSGRVSVVAKDQAGVETEIRTLKVGDYFGERALMKNDVRSSSVRCKKACRLLKLRTETFVMMLGPLEDVFNHKMAQYDTVPEGSWRRGSVDLRDLKVLGVLGKGSYGYVQLMQDARSGREGRTYALKAVAKQRIVDTHQKQHVLDEKALMMRIDHPFIVKLVNTYSDPDCLYFLMEAALGGELFPILRRLRVFPIPQARFYAAQVILCFEYLHQRDFVYRDLKPENLLLDEQGYLKLTDFGFCKHVPHKTWTMCGTPEYLAPEVIKHKGHGKAVDWWTIGVFLFEMLASHTPFYGRGDDLEMYDRICQGHYKFPSHFPKDLQAVIAGLLEPKPHERLGMGRTGAEAIKNSEWFALFDWQGLLWRTLPAPMPIEVKDQFDLTNYPQDVKKLRVVPYLDDGTDWDRDF